MALVTRLTPNNQSDLVTRLTPQKRPSDQVSRLTPKKPSDLLPSALVSALQPDSLTVETHTDEGSDEQPLLNTDSYLFSNFATATVMEMLANGATGKVQESLLPHFLGMTMDQIHEQYPLVNALFHAAGFAGGPSIKLHNRFWIQRSDALKSDVDDVLKGVYSSDICYISFFTKIFKLPDQVKSEMNTWIREKTCGIIQDIFGSHTVDPTTRLLNTTSIDFEGQWSVPFQDAGCRTFTLPSGDVIRTQYMTSNSPQYVKQFKHFKVLSIPFKQHPATEYTMLFYLPDETADFLDLEQWIGKNEDVILEVDKPTERVAVSNLLIPKFTIKMRGKVPLDPSGFSLDKLMENNSSVGMGTILCNTYLHVSEKGVRAAGSATAYVSEFTPTVKDTATPAAATQSVSSSSTTPPAPATPTTPAAANATPTTPATTATKPTITSFAPANSTTTVQTPPRKKARFMANRPFMFYVRDSKYGRLLFCGGITDPLGTSFS